MLIDVERSEARLNSKLDPTRGRPTTAQMSSAGALTPAPPPPTAPRAQAEGGELAQVRTDLLRAQTVEKNLKNARLAGHLVELEEYERRIAEFGRLVREKLQALTREEAERLAAETEPRTIIAVLGEKIDALLGDLGARMLAKPTAAAAEAAEGEDDDATALEDEVLEPPGAESTAQEHTQVS